MNETIATLAAQALQEIAAKVDAALLQAGFSRSYVNRRRGQVNRYRKVNKEKS